MPADPNQPVPFDPSVLAELACPVCHGDLWQDGKTLVCADCNRAYPIVDGIPILIPLVGSQQREPN
jgi:uncharacterized protein YbaR (Trm112 family)